MSEQTPYDDFVARGNAGMFCKACGVFDVDVRFGPDGVKTCACGERRWSTSPPAIAAPPAHLWALTDFDRIVLIHYGIAAEAAA